MTELASFLDDFSKPDVQRSQQEPGIDAKTLEAKRLEAFEEGYRAGWDDAVKAQNEDASRVSGAFVQQLSDLSFTYQEAFAAATKAVTPLLEEMVTTLLPEIAKQTMGAHVVEQLGELAQQIGTAPVEIAVAPGRSHAVAALLEGEFAFAIELVEDPTLAAEQADIRFGETERQIDLTEMLNSFTSAVEGFAEDTRRKIANG